MPPPSPPRAILLFWLPLALQWVLMAVEGPFLAAVIARLVEPELNLAAYGVAFAFAILVESPVIMLMSAATALVEDGESYRKMRRFAWGLNLFSTLLLLLLLLPPVFQGVVVGAVGLPLPVAERVYGALWILLPWPAAIGYRRFLHGVLIRAGRTRRVAYGTGIRLLAMGGTALFLARTELPGVWVGAAALSTGVLVEAWVARRMARRVVSTLLEAGRVVEGGEEEEPLEPRGIARTGSGGGSALEGGVAGGRGGRGEGGRELTYPNIFRFYTPLALTSFIGLTTQPLLTFFMGRSPSPVESLALFPVVVSLSFLFSTLGLSYQEAAIALMGKRGGAEAGALQRFALFVGVGGGRGGLALIAWTPLGELWFGTVSGLSPELVALAIPPARVATLLPFLSVVIGLQRAILVQARDTAPITMATLLEVMGIALLFPLFGWGMGLMGVTAAFSALLGGRLLGVGYLLFQGRRVRLG